LRSQGYDREASAELEAEVAVAALGGGVYELTVTAPVRPPDWDMACVFCVMRSFDRRVGPVIEVQGRVRSECPPWYFDNAEGVGPDGTNAAEAAFQKAVSLQQSGDLQGAAVEFARATKLDRSDPRFWIARGVALLELRHFKEAARCLREGVDLKPHYGEADARVWLGDALWLSGHRTDAEQQWLVASKMKPAYTGYENPINEAKRRVAGSRPT
jgi:tetratricopeptide (TPR) repeat protein